MSETFAPCPFCGNNHYTVSYKRDKRKVNGIYYEICTIHCAGCTCTISQAGASRDQAKDSAIRVWNKRFAPIAPN